MPFQSRASPNRLPELGRPWAALLVQALALLIALGWWAARAVPFSLGTATQSVSSAPQLLPCISYSPFRHREGRTDINPFNYKVSVTPAQIEEDLRILKTRTNCIRTYGLSQGLDAVPAVVQKLGMHMRLGVWLTRDEAHNRRELERGLALAGQFKDVVELLIVGNEVLLRRELSAEALAKILTDAREISPVPITYADVWEFWQRHATLAKSVDVVTVHILPYWEDDPVAVEDAVSHVFRIASNMQQQFAGKPIWVGETGWPAAGRQRAGAVPGKVEQSRFISELLSRPYPLGNSWGYSVIEGFDQPWKRSFEGAMGGYWGLFDHLGQPRAQFSGSVVEDAQWWRGPLGAVLGAMLAGLLVLFSRKIFSTYAVAAPLMLAGGLLGALAPLQWLMMQQWDRSPREQALSVALALLSAAVTVVSLSAQSIKINQAARLAVLFAASTAALVLLLDARYRPFPWWWFLAPTAALLAQRLNGADAAAPATTTATAWATYQELLLVVVLVSCSVMIIQVEGWLNAQAMFYCALLLVLAWTLGWPLRTNTSRASKAAGAHSSVV